MASRRPILLLVPTEVEERHLVASDVRLRAGDMVRARCGFGPIAAAARTAQLVAAIRPRHAVLVGIAGTYDPVHLPVGAASAFAAVAVDGIGAGEGDRLVLPSALGFPQWPGDAAAGVPAIGDRIELASASGDPRHPLLLTACAASADPAQAGARRRRFPDAAAEDMEGFGAALACVLAGVPLAVVRGISNVAGERDPSRWRIREALAAASDLLGPILESR